MKVSAGVSAYAGAAEPNIKATAAADETIALNAGITLGWAPNVRPSSWSRGSSVALVVVVVLHVPRKSEDDFILIDEATLDLAPLAPLPFLQPSTGLVVETTTSGDDMSLT